MFSIYRFGIHSEILAQPLPITASYNQISDGYQPTLVFFVEPAQSEAI